MKWLTTLVLAGLFLTALLVGNPTFAKTLEELQKEINDLQSKIATSKSQQKTLSGEIARLNDEIALTKLQIETTHAKINDLSVKIGNLTGKIHRLEDSLEQVSRALAQRIVKTYIAGRDNTVIYLLSSASLSDFISRFEYLRVAQKHDKSLMYRMAITRKNYNDQKVDLEEIKRQKEELFRQLKVLQASLERQNLEKQTLLEVTRSDEQRYQELLAQAQRELVALQTSQFVGKRDVKKGEVIGLMGSTGFSTGPHLHFGVYNLAEDKSAEFNYNSGSNNPFDFLSSRTVRVDSGACYDKSGDTTLGGGSWDWSMGSPSISQCYGKTPFSFVYSNGQHEGVDMYDNNDLAIRAVDDGVAHFYRGTTSFGNNVRVFHSNGKMTLYLHLQ